MKRENTQRAGIWPQILVVVAMLVGFAAASPQASACKDCPFPMRAGEDRWIMPGGNVSVRIEQIARSGTASTERITLTDVHNGNVIATGIVRRLAHAAVMNTVLRDGEGHTIRAYVRFIDQHRTHIQAKFTCTDCTYRELLD